ncbi:MAG: hypothetical protein ACI9LG_001702 [Moritella dasanensis]|jgi:hypothetical protein
MQAMKERDDEIPLVDYVQIDDAYWGCVRPGVRGRGAKGKRPFIAEAILKWSTNFGMRFSTVSAEAPINPEWCVCN